MLFLLGRSDFPRSMQVSGFKVGYIHVHVSSLNSSTHALVPWFTLYNYHYHYIILSVLLLLTIALSNYWYVVNGRLYGVAWQCMHDVRLMATNHRLELEPLKRHSIPCKSSALLMNVNGIIAYKDTVYKNTSDYRADRRRLVLMVRAF